MTPPSATHVHHRGLVVAIILAVAAALIAVPAPAIAAPATTGTITGTVLGAGSCASGPAPFGDVKRGNELCDDILWLSGTRITQVTDDRYRPAAPVSRAAMTAFLYRLSNPGKADPTCTKAPYTEAPFPDVPTTSPFCGTISWAKELGITVGKADGTFAPAAAVRRDEMALFLYRVTHLDAPAAEPCDAQPFPDVAADRPACGEMSWMAAATISTGYADGTYRPRTPVSRAAMAAFLHRTVAHTDVAPGLSTVPLRGLAGVEVFAYRDGGSAVVRATANAKGVFTLKAPPGDYRVCIDGSAAGAYQDGCVGNIPWPFTLPTAPADAPVVTVTAGTTTRAGVVILADQPAAESGRRGVADPAPGYGSYAFIDVTGRGDRAFYSACRPIHYVVRPDGAPVGGDLLIEAALARISRTTGLRFIYDGPSSETPADRLRTLYQPTRYGPGYAPVLIGWSDEYENPRLAGDVVGFAGSQAVYGTVGTRLTPALVTGTVVLDAPDLSAVMNYYGEYGIELAYAVVLHELAHLVGLDHVDDTGELMYPEAGAMLDFGPGDLTGLYQAGQGPCVMLPDPATSTRAMRLGPGVGGSGSSGAGSVGSGSSGAGSVGSGSSGAGSNSADIFRTSTLEP